MTYKLKLKHTTAPPTFPFSVPDSTARPTAITMAPPPKTKAAAIRMAPSNNLTTRKRRLEAASLVKMSQQPNTRAPKKTKFAPPASWLGNDEQNDDAEQNGESEQIPFPADSLSSRMVNQIRCRADQISRAKGAFPADAAGTSNASAAETSQPAPAGAAESKPQEACNK